MPCETAIIRDAYTVKPDMLVADALEYLKENRIRMAPVVDDDGKLCGAFSLSVLLKSLLPISVTMDEGVQRLEFVIGAGPGVAKRLRKTKPRTVREVMATDIVVVHPTTAIWEIVRLLVKYGSPIPVIEEQSGKFVGVVSEQSSIEELHSILIEVEKDEAEARGQK